MASVVSSISTGGNFVFCWNILKPLNVDIVQKCQICVLNENLNYHKVDSGQTTGTEVLYIASSFTAIHNVDIFGIAWIWKLVW